MAEGFLVSRELAPAAETEMTENETDKERKNNQNPRRTSDENADIPKTMPITQQQAATATSTISSTRRKERLYGNPPPLPPPPSLKSLSGSAQIIEQTRLTYATNPSTSTFDDSNNSRPFHNSPLGSPSHHTPFTSSTYSLVDTTPTNKARRRSGPNSATSSVSTDGHYDESKKRDEIARNHQYSSPQPPGVVVSSPRYGEKSRQRRSILSLDLIVPWINLQNFTTTVAVILWYLLGVVSITTTKVLLSTIHVKPLWLSLQQFLFGGWFLNLLLQCRLISSVGKQPLPKLRGKFNTTKEYESSDPLTELILTAIFFGFGFVATNYSFQHGAASFVETIKASEPITSAIVAVAFGVDTVSLNEGISLLGIVSGVLVSTLGSYLVQSTKSSSFPKSTSPLITSPLYSCLIVMVSNLCFSFRGVHQKLLRSTNSGSSHMMDDANLQYRIQCISALIFFFPALIFDVPGMLKTMWKNNTTAEGYIFSRALAQYVGLSLVNGFAFVSYNLASTYVLTRLAVVHHAALNCVRRIFAIVVTSLIFQVPLGAIGILGILVSFISFMFYTHFKVQRQNKPRPVSSLLPMSAVFGSS